MERMNGVGNVLAVHHGEHDQYEFMRYFNFTPEQMDVYTPLPWVRFMSQFVHGQVQVDEMSKLIDDPVNEYQRSFNVRLQRRAVESERILRTLRPHAFSALIIATTSLSPLSVYQHLLPLVAGSGHIVLYSPFKETLYDTFTQMRKSEECIAVDLTESWLREHQVLPSRTHPMMTTSGSGGYVLSAIRVLLPEPTPMQVEEPEEEEKDVKRLRMDSDSI
jgi:tRNA (adenine-N(1)-)-methyltransferase non-catalytic subunit